MKTPEYEKAVQSMAAYMVQAQETPNENPSDVFFAYLCELLKLLKGMDPVTKTLATFNAGYDVCLAVGDEKTRGG